LIIKPQQAVIGAVGALSNIISEKENRWEILNDPWVYLF
jgi:hypothetical protein